MRGRSRSSTKFTFTFKLPSRHKTHYHIMYDDNFKFPETVWSLAIWVQRLSKTPIDPVDPSMNRQSRTD